MQPPERTPAVCTECAKSDLTKLAAVFERFKGDGHALISILQQAQEIFEDWLTNRKITVRRAETLSGIAARNKIPLQDLMEVNNLSTAFVRPGQVLKIPNGLGKRKGKGGSDAGGVK